MFSLKLKYSDQSSNLLELSYPGKMRTFIGLLLPVLILIYFRENRDASFLNNISLYLIALMSILIGQYDERWYFNRADHKIIRKIGLRVWYKTQALSFSDVEYIEVRCFGRRKMSWLNKTDLKTYQKYARLSLRLKTDRIKNIDVVGGKYVHQLLKKGAAISDFCGIPFQNKTDN